VKLSRDEQLTAYNCVALVMRGFRAAPAPWAVQSLYDRLDAEVRAMSRVGHESEGVAEELDPWISTQAAAQELEQSARQTRRLKADLGGEMFNGRLMFRASKVRAYAEGRRDGGVRPADRAGARRHVG
jgi:hypothetical protein